MLKTNKLASDKTSIMDETLALVLARKHLHKTFPTFYVGGVQKNTYFYSCGNYGGCGQIGLTDTFKEFGPCRYGLGISTGVDFKICEGKKKTSHQY